MAAHLRAAIARQPINCFRAVRRNDGLPCDCASGIEFREFRFQLLRRFRIPMLNSIFPQCHHHALSRKRREALITVAGAIPFTRTSGPSFMASSRIRWLTAALLTSYAPLPCFGTTAFAELVRMSVAGRFCSFENRFRLRRQNTLAVTLTCSVRPKAPRKCLPLCRRSEKWLGIDYHIKSTEPQNDIIKNFPMLSRDVNRVQPAVTVSGCNTAAASLATVFAVAILIPPPRRAPHFLPTATQYPAPMPLPPPTTRRRSFR